MQSFPLSRRTAQAFALIVALGVAACALPAHAQSVTVTVSGQPVSLNPPPIERAGRVFVPLRGVFEHLGATVVYANRMINATGNNRTISLTIGSTTAVVNGQTQTLDVAPFIIGASTYVPLRFVAQALGATVNWDGTNRVVAIVPAGGGGPPTVVTPVPTSAPPSPVRLKALEPSAGAVVAAKKPTISAEFTRRVDPNSLKITLDGLDITNAATRSETGIVYAPPSPLQASEHTVRITGKDLSGETFDRSWSFTSGSTAPTNSITIFQPVNGATVGGTFTVRGKTLPNAQVHTVAGAVVTAGVFTFGTGTYIGDTIADGNGNFSQTVTLNAASGGSIGLTVTSTDPVTKESAQVKLTLQAR
jgi:hypothetical protein